MSSELFEYSHDGQNALGPVTHHELVRLSESHIISDATYIRHVGETAWKRLGDLETASSRPWWKNPVVLVGGLAILLVLGLIISSIDFKSMRPAPPVLSYPVRDFFPLADAVAQGEKHLATVEQSRDNLQNLIQQYINTTNQGEHALCLLGQVDLHNLDTLRDMRQMELDYLKNSFQPEATPAGLNNADASLEHLLEANRQASTYLEDMPGHYRSALNGEPLSPTEAESIVNTTVGARHFSDIIKLLDAEQKVFRHYRERNEFLLHNLGYWHFDGDQVVFDKPETAKLFDQLIQSSQPDMAQALLDKNELAGLLAPPIPPAP